MNKFGAKKKSVGNVLNLLQNNLEYFFLYILVFWLLEYFSSSKNNKFLNLF